MFGMKYMMAFVIVNRFKGLMHLKLSAITKCTTTHDFVNIITICDKFMFDDEPLSFKIW